MQRAQVRLAKLLNHIGAMTTSRSSLTAQPVAAIVSDTQKIALPHYTINLMWINKKLDKDQRYIHPSTDEKSLHDNLLKHLFQWAETNPASTVNFWFDSELMSQKAVQNTYALIEAYSSTHPQSAPIVLKDIRELPLVKIHHKVFSPRTPVYFRADLLRLIATCDVLRATNHESYFVYADLDVTPQDGDMLFDEETRQKLVRYGFVVAEGKGVNEYENSFHIISNKNNNLLNAMRIVLVEQSILSAYLAFRWELLDGYRLPLYPTRPLEQLVFDAYKVMLKYFFYLEGRGKLVYYTDELISADEFNFDLFDGERGNCFLKFIPLDVSVIMHKWDQRPSMPTKKIKMPRVSLEYADKELKSVGYPAPRNEAELYVWQKEHAEEYP